jgi:hypothetical protein
MIAMTRVGNETATAQRPTRGGLEMIKATGNGWGAAQTLVPIQPGYNRYNPNFVPDSSFLLYSESVCPTADWDGPDCDADSDSSAKTWAMASTPGSPRVLLAKAAAGGVADGGRKDLADTFPRSTPFQSKQGSGKLFWFTVASRREPGLRAKTDDNQQLLWMFAVDPAAILAGKDGSYPGFYLPFQDLKTSNHIAQWTQKIVSDNPPPPPAPAPPPPPPPVPTR